MENRYSPAQKRDKPSAIYEMSGIPPSSAQFIPQTKKFASPPLPKYGQLTKENVRRFEEEQERVAREKRPMTPASGTATFQSHPQNQQVFVLDRIVEMDVAKNESEKYKCCCGCTDFYRASWCVGFMEAIIAAIALITVIVNFSKLGRNYLDHFVATVCICGCYMVILTFHFCGLQSKSACMLIPNLLAQFITITLLTVVSGLIGSSLTADDQSPLVIWAGVGPLYGDLAKDAGLKILTFGTILIGACILASLAYIWFFYICVMCYRQLNEQQRHRRGLVYNETNSSMGKIVSGGNTPSRG